jgi:hypothetical protein
VKNHGEDLVQLGGNEVGGTLDTHTESKNTCLAVVGVGGGEVVAEVLQQRDDNLAGRQAGGKNVKKTKSGASRCDILVLAGEITQLSDNVKSLQGQLLTALQALDLELPVADALHEECKSLGAVVVLDRSRRGKLEHELDEIAKVLGQKSGFAAKQGLENLESLHGVVLITLVNGSLEDGNHGGDSLLEESERLGVLIRLQKHGQTAQAKHGVGPDIGTLGVLDGLAEQVVQVRRLAGEGITSLLKCCPNDVCANLPVAGSCAGGSLVKVAGQISPLSVLEILSRNGGDDAGGRVPGQCDILVQCELEELVAESILLVRRESSPVPDSKLPGLNGSQLTEVGPGVSAKDLQESIKRGGRTVVVLVQRSRGILDNLGVGCTVLDWRGR